MHLEYDMSYVSNRCAQGAVNCKLWCNYNSSIQNLKQEKSFCFLNRQSQPQTNCERQRTFYNTLQIIHWYQCGFLQLSETKNASQCFTFAVVVIPYNFALTRLVTLFNNSVLHTWMYSCYVSVNIKQLFVVPEKLYKYMVTLVVLSSWQWITNSPDNVIWS